MECSEELESRLLTQPWASVCFDESTFIAKACFGDTGYMLLISDLSGVWYESADAEAVEQRSKRLHGLLSPALAGQPHAATSFSCQRPAGGLSLRVRSELSGLPFYWDFRCRPAPVATVCRHLVRPLIGMSLALQHQVQELTSLLLRKDAEIEDYRESGATLSRDRLRTEPFQEETFLQNFMAESLPQICSAGDGHAFTSALRQLYMAVMLQEAKPARKRHHPEDTEDLAPTAETSGHPDPAPQSPVDETASLSKEATPTSSPVQKPRLPVAKAKPKKAKGLFS
ncbi:non-homologous end-joining factor 1 isoform X3 [Centrocercus urophasianus]|uniref:non-homologous end-joining factor 1 isoform X3 n=1 Tax=Centrocercus urophasianus TaxID=9002 RepID=UPI001C653248|nr:non-homologous end-joining factor 1 isoform X3 [Centrocercus urophasianus]